MILEEKNTKYRKKKDSSTSKSSSKSDHKHDYSKECLLIVEGNVHPKHAVYCSICGKIKNTIFFETEKEEGGLYRVLDSDEVYEKYKDLDHIFVKDVWQQYIPINKASE